MAEILESKEFLGATPLQFRPDTRNDYTSRTGTNCSLGSDDVSHAPTLAR
jgi:hypothetical protein